MNVKELVNRITTARETQDGTQIKQGPLSISETELSGIYEAFGTSRGTMAWLATALVESQLTIIKDALSLSLSASVIGPAERAEAQLDLAQIEHLIGTMKEAQLASPPWTASQMYSHYVAKITADLDG